MAFDAGRRPARVAWLEWGVANGERAGCVFLLSATPRRTRESTVLAIEHRSRMRLSIGGWAEECCGTRGSCLANGKKLSDKPMGVRRPRNSRISDKIVSCLIALMGPRRCCRCSMRSSIALGSLSPQPLYTPTPWESRRASVRICHGPRQKGLCLWPFSQPAALGRPQPRRCHRRCVQRRGPAWCADSRGGGEGVQRTFQVVPFPWVSFICSPRQHASFLTCRL